MGQLQGGGTHRYQLKINILWSLDEEAIITRGTTTEGIRISHTGPITLIDNSSGGRLSFQDNSPLQIMSQLAVGNTVETEELENESN
ncbi:hypothetical protein [Geopsychrobacter electrodiphilus]|uniref:hypothetical protein n=1 Tax=Geopsychrobacter electrodiphilus TaxID=225196 RepID=UPI0003A6A974|nr:hypothetical protein [Geopsychrobacter electrodiphilus]